MKEKELMDFCETNHRFPNYRSKDPLEKSLYNWQRSRKNWPVIRDLRLKFNIKSHSNQKLEKTANDYLVFCEFNHRLPKCRESSVFYNFERRHKDHPIVISMKEKYGDRKK